MLCSLCPRKCNIDRTDKIGYCGVNEKIRVARAAPHYWEEPCISGNNGSGTVFFSGCNLGCVFCQNYQLSREAYGKDVTEYELMKIFDNLINKGVHNINLVTPTHYSHVLSKVLKEFNSPVPIVYNTSSYEIVDSLKELEGLVDIYLPDIKYYDNEPALKYSKAKDYFLYASKAVKEMYRQVGNLIIDDNGIAKKGILIRHMLLPGNISQAINIFSWVADNISIDTYISVMRQYTPYGEAKNMSPIDRSITAKEYKIAKQKIEEIGFENIYFQKKSSSDEIFIPDFNLEGVENL